MEKLIEYFVVHMKTGDIKRTFEDPGDAVRFCDSLNRHPSTDGLYIVQNSETRYNERMTRVMTTPSERSPEFYGRHKVQQLRNRTVAEARQRRGHFGEII